VHIVLRLPIGVADSNERKATRNTLLVEREILAAQKLVERARLIGPHRAVHGDTARRDPAELRPSSGEGGAGHADLVRAMHPQSRALGVR
jgi:hypothetical protein